MNLTRRYVDVSAHEYAQAAALPSTYLEDFRAGRLGNVHRVTSYSPEIVPRGMRPDEFIRKTDLAWFGTRPLVHGDRIVFPAAPNLAVNSGLHITALKTFSPTPTHTAGTTGAVKTGGVDSSTIAVSATVHQFISNSSRRFIATAFSTGTVSYSTSNKRVTADFRVTSTQFGGSTATAKVHRRYGLSNSTANATDSLFSMLSGFELNFNNKAYDITVRTQTNYTGS